MEFRILGPLEVVDDDRRPLMLGGPKQRALLAVLLLHRGEVLSTDRLIDVLWGERAPATAATSVRVYVSNLRKALGTEVLLTRGGGYLLAPTAGLLDAERFHVLVKEARSALAEGDAARALELLSFALALWRGEPLADFGYEQFAQSEIARLEEARVTALEDRIEAELMLGQHGASVGELEALIEAHPRRERLLGQLMLALYRSGRHADALEAYRKGRRTLSEELGLEPGPELRALEQRILNHDPGLEAPGPPSRAPAAAARRRTGSARALIAAGGVIVLAAAIAAGVVELAGGKVSVRAAANTVAVIDTRTDSVTGAVAVGARPGAIAFGSGSLWVANQDDETVSRVDPTTLQTLRTISLADPATGIAAAGGGVWVATSSSTGTFVSVSRIDPSFDAIDRTVRVGNVVPGTSAAIAAHGGSLWVAPFSGELTQLDPQTGRVTKQVDPNAAPASVDFDAQAAWVSDSDADAADRIDATGLVTPVAVGHDPSGIAVGDGDVWVADTGDGTVMRIDPDTRAVITTIPVGHAPKGVAIGAGSVWVANTGDGTVSRIDPHTENVIATITVGGSPQAITIVDGRAWVTVDARALSPPAQSGGTLRVDSPVDVTSMDPPQAGDPLSLQLLSATCAKLLNYPDRPGLAGSHLVPEVAQSLPARSADGHSYTFRIRSGFRFSPPSNAPVTAQTFKYTIERALNPRMRSPYAGEFRDITGADAYMAGKAAHISGVIARGNTLTIRLTAPAPDLLARIAEPAFCAVPSDTPIDPNGVRVIPSAGPYRVASYIPGQGIVLTPNLNYRGNRPHRLHRIEVAVDIPNQRAVAQVEAGTADYAGDVPSSDAATLAARYGPGSAAAARGKQQYFVNPLQQLDFLALNTHRALFADVRMRRAINYAIDRTALARLGDEYVPLPEHPTDHYLPPGFPGYREARIYPHTPDLTRARTLAKGRTPATAILYTCDVSPCDQQAQIIKTDLAAIGVQVQVKAYPDQILYTRTATPREPFDLAWVGWVADYPDPDAMLNFLLEGGTVIPTFNDPGYRQRLAAAAQLTGPKRYLTYAKLDADLARNAAPLAAFGNLSNVDFFSARIGCQIFGIYGMDLAALCTRNTHR